MTTRRIPRASLASAKVLNGGHELSVHGLQRRDDSFTLHYTIAPPLPDAGDATPVLLSLEALDGIGNERSTPPSAAPGPGCRWRPSSYAANRGRS
ncbi:hypothetical protein ACH4YO_28645 [Streptomyces noursei]|uniref:hypothetical protein n=1 Tax=Streptomyces noursei TaxID=1971 RepID=UPI0033DA158A